MAINIKLGKNNSPANKLSKSVNYIRTVPCHIFTEEDVVNPVLFLDRGSVSVEETSQINYCEIPAFGRFYFCRIVHDKTRIWVHCSVDPMMSFQSSIKALNVRVIRQENEKLSYLQDNQLPIKANKIVEHKFVSNVIGTPDKTLNQLVLATL